MKESVSEQIANCLRTQQGTHTLYRAFGLSVVDSTNPPMRRDILIQLSTYYPDVSLNDVQITRVESNGEFEYTVDVRS